MKNIQKVNSTASENTSGTKRVSLLRKRMINAKPELCIERGYWITESYKETEGESAVIRTAKSLKKILENMSISIDDGELIVGKTTSKQRGGALLPEVAWEWYLDEIDSMSTREWNKFAPISETEKIKMREFLPYWKGKSLYEKFMAIVPKEVIDRHNIIEAAGGHAANNIHKGHMSCDYEKVIKHGLIGIKQQVEEERKKLNIAFLKDFEKSQFLKAVDITLNATIGLAKRYANLANSMAEKEKDTQRKAELKRIADTCSRVPENPARNFFEAMQSMWFAYIATMIEGWSFGIGFGRPDQFLFPFYKKDFAEGKITPEEARELIALFYIKINSSVIPMCLAATKSFAGNPLTADITLGGLTRDGRDAVNELSYLFLEAEQEVKLSSEDLIIRIHKNTPDAFVMKACEVAKALRGKLKFLSDETTIQQLLTDGKPIELARDYCLDGCNNPTVAGYSQDLPGGLFNLPLMLELALNNGVSRITKQQIGPKTGDPRKFKSYEELWEAFKKQFDTLFPYLIIFKNIDDKLYADFTPTPFQSALFHGCIEKGLDITQGGTFPYLTHANSLSGAPNVGDSLAAVKKAVFEDKKITMDQLVNALDKNFEGEDKILHILESAPKFGNDNDYVDSIVNDVLVHGSKEARQYTGIGGAITSVAAGVITGNVPLGYMVGALPDGRKAGEPLSEGGISPYQGRNVSGPTATMRSVAKLDLAKMTNGAVLNMKFNPEALKDAPKMRKFAFLIRTFLETGGALVQFNIVDTQTLKDAQRQPEKYKDLLVRVATYSAYFVELSPELQDDIIARMEFEEA
jgi:choline trimethylamine-lyase